MNLVAKEFVASRNDEDGVLVLSEFAGAAAELPDAVTVNPYDIGGTAKAIYEALNLTREDRRTRMQSLRRRVFAHDGAAWAQSFLDALVRQTAPAPTGLHDDKWIERVRKARLLCLLLDYDGTLVDFTKDPAAARPDAELQELLQQLGLRQGTEVHVVSGRARSDLEGWLGELPVHLHAEHGLWTRARGTQVWRRALVPPLRGRERARGILDEVRLRVPGSHIEEKEESLVFHWRASDARFAEVQVRDLEVSLRLLMGGEGVRIQRGACVLEVRNASAGKALAAQAARAGAGEEALLVAIGDDATDEDLFEAVLPGGVAVKVGEGETLAPFRLANVRAVREALGSLLA